MRKDLGAVELNIPRDHESEFDFQIVPKKTRDLSTIENKVISMYEKGMSQRDISEHIEDIYRKVTNGKTIFPTDGSLIKMLYLATMSTIKNGVYTLEIGNK